MPRQSTVGSSLGTTPIVKPKKRLMSIRWTLPLLVLTPVILGIVLTNRLAARSSAKAIKESIEDIGAEVAANIGQEIVDYLEKPILLSNSVVSKAQNGTLDTTNMDTLSVSFWQAIQTELLPDSLYYANASGELAYSRRTLDETPVIRVRDEATQWRVITYGIDQGGALDAEAVDNANKIKTYDPRKRPWYKEAKNAYDNAQNRDEMLSIWAPVYPDQQTRSLVLTLATPVLNSSNQLEVFASDIFLLELNTFLKDLAQKQNRDPDAAIIRAFIVNHKGSLIATSAESNILKKTVETGALLAATDSSDPIVQQAARQVAEWKKDEENATFLEMDSDEGKQLVYSQNIRELQDVRSRIKQHGSFMLPEWHIVVTIPQAKYMAPIRKNNQQSILWGGGITIAASLLALLGVHLILKPIEKLNQAASDIKNNRFDPRTLADVMKRPDEFSTLADVFDDMATVVVGREHTLAEQVKQLETEKSQFGGKEGDRHTLETAITHARQARKRYQNL